MDRLCAPISRAIKCLRSVSICNLRQNELCFNGATLWNWSFQGEHHRIDVKWVFCEAQQLKSFISIINGAWSATKTFPAYQEFPGKLYTSNDDKGFDFHSLLMRFPGNFSPVSFNPRRSFRVQFSTQSKSQQVEALFMHQKPHSIYPAW